MKIHYYKANKQKHTACKINYKVAFVHLEEGFSDDWKDVNCLQCIRQMSKKLLQKRESKNNANLRI